ncbi:MAG TPA: hypothetical protein ENI27_05325 [bacterium]|nr:hypothetical protein [bacterium]
MKSTHKETKWMVGFQEIMLQPGQFIFGRKKAAKELKMSERSIRTCLDSLRKHQNVAIKTTNKFSIVTVINWESYQSENVESTIKTTNKRPANDQQVTTNKNVKNVKNVKKDLSTPRSPDKKRPDHGGRDGISGSVKIEEMRKNPDKVWDKLINLYFDRFGYRPTWSKNQGIRKEFVSLNNTLKILDGDMDLLLKCFEEYLADGDPFLSKNGHRPSLINNLLDGYLRKLDGEQSGREKYYVPDGF